MRKALLLVLAALFVLPSTLLLPSARAGGWAAVRLDAHPTNVAVEVPVQIGFTVLQHDTHPVNVEEEFGPEGEVTLEAQHRQTAQIYRAAATQQGAEGHYVVEAVFPRAGEWEWSIIPAPFAGTSFKTLTVLDAPAAPSAVSVPHPGRIVAGSCGRMGEPRFELGAPAQDAAETAADGGIPTDTTAVFPVAVSQTSLDVPLTTLLDTPHAVAVASIDPASPAPVVCGDLIGQPRDGELVVGLRPVAGSGVAGVATLREENGKTLVTVYLITASEPAPADPSAAAPSSGSTDAPDPAADTVAVQIVDMAFSPSTLTVPAGATVVWTNADAVAHTVTGQDLAFPGSDVLAPGATFSQTFTEPGTYAYHCFPHPSMVATITVTA